MQLNLVQRQEWTAPPVREASLGKLSAELNLNRSLSHVIWLPRRQRGFWVARGGLGPCAGPGGGVSAAEGGVSHGCR